MSSNSAANCPLVFACDEDYAMPLATALRSIAEADRSAPQIEVYVLSANFSEKTKQKVIDSLPRGSLSIRWLSVDLAAFSHFSTLKHISTATYARFLISSMLPESIHRILYLDADILVLKDLTPILELDLEGAVLGAVVDRRLDAMAKTGNTTIEGLPHVRAYFNAGVLLIDFDRWRAERISEKSLAYLERNPHSPYSDQDALNVACDGLWKRMDPRWNFYQIDLEKPLAALAPAERPGIVHFQGWQKPWEAKTLNVNARFYDGFRSQTSFAYTPQERLKDVPLVIWSRVKRTLRQSSVFSQLWNQIRSLQASAGRNAGRRFSNVQGKQQ